MTELTHFKALAAEWKAAAAKLRSDAAALFGAEKRPNAELKAAYCALLSAGEYDYFTETLQAAIDLTEAGELLPEPAVGADGVAPSARIAELNRALAAMGEQLEQRNARTLYLEGLINSPQLDNFLEAVKLEAAHQIERWGAKHDEGKKASDWFWLIGYLGGKALNAAIAGNRERTLHHVITTAAVCLNWHRSLTGESTAMRPGIATPKGEGN